MSPATAFKYMGLEVTELASRPVAVVQAAKVPKVTVELRAAGQFAVPPALLKLIALLLELISVVVEALKSAYFGPVPGEEILTMLFRKLTIDIFVPEK